MLSTCMGSRATRGTVATVQLISFRLRQRDKGRQVGNGNSHFCEGGHTKLDTLQVPYRHEPSVYCSEVAGRFVRMN